MLMRKETDGTIVFSALSLRVPAELKDDLDTLAYSAMTTTSEIMIQLIQGLVDANRARINQFNKLRDEFEMNWGHYPDDETGNDNG